MKMLEEYDKSKSKSTTLIAHPNDKCKSSAKNEPKLFSINDIIKLGKQYIEDKIYIITNQQPGSPSLSQNVSYVQIMLTNCILNMKVETIV